MLKVKCRVCGKTLVGSGCCGCPNMTTIRDDHVTASDLDLVTLEESINNVKKSTLFTSDDLKYQEARRKRKVRKLTFEER